MLKRAANVRQQIVPQSTKNAAPLKPTNRRKKRHLRIVGALVVVVALVGMLVGSKIEKVGPFPELLAIRNAILQSANVRDVGVTISKNWTNGTTSNSILVTVIPSGALSDDSREANEIASIALKSNPKASQVDVLGIVIVHTVNFGLLHYSSNKSFYHTPLEWQQSLGKTDSKGAEQSIL